MSEEGEKGFVIKDRRSFDERGERKQEEEGKEQPENAPEKKAPEKESQRPPLPEVNFSSLILSLDLPYTRNLPPSCSIRGSSETRIG